MRHTRLLFMFMFLIFILTGCLGKEEISDLALVTAVGIDKGEEENILITAQIARPAEARGDAGAGGGTGEPMWTAIAEGQTIFEAIRNLARFSSRRVYWGHNMVIVISEEIAEDGIVDVIDFFTRNNELRMRTWILVTEEMARDLIPVKTGIEVLPGESIDHLFRYSPIVAEAPKSDAMSLSMGYLREYTHPYLALVNLKSRGIAEGEEMPEYGNLPQAELSGTALFRDDKMVGKLKDRESRGFLWFIGEVETAIIPIEFPEGDGNASIELRDNSFQITPKYKNGEVSFAITISTKADLVELGVPTGKNYDEIFALLEPILEDYIQEDIEMLVSKLQKEYQLDSIGLATYFRAKFPQYWDDVKEDWDELFPNIAIDVNVTAEITNPQLFRLPTRPMKE